ncbi:MAG TPA: tryptophan 2,3-dioxygenase family protein [Thermoanaerobaculia bacterium]|jgi:tryptophan 2,3-dioxygenase|nr:tryptophan 2,3-dioxygenase family protein [Thermoanaerobaculia bacterium]
MPYTYTSYLRLDELLGLQTPASREAPGGEEHDEMLFIVIHQVYELWFKQVLHEIDLLHRSLDGNDRPLALSTLKRILTIFKTLVAQVDVLETMTPVSFQSFRYRLDSASGFQSIQFRELEAALGERRPGMTAHIPEGSPERERVERRLHEPSLYSSFLRFLVLNGYEIPQEVLERDAAEPPAEDARVQEILVRIYRSDPENRDVCERLVDLDEGLQEWRYRHVKMVQRTIGMKTGTGGSAGVEYLKDTLFKPLFPDLWAIRTAL